MIHAPLLDSSKTQLQREELHSQGGSSELGSMDSCMDLSFSLALPPSSENVFAGSDGKVVRRRQKERNPFRNMTNCEATQAVPHQDLFYNFSKKTSYSPSKPCLKENRVSQETRVSETESLCNFAEVMQEEKSSNLQLAEQLQERVRLLDQKISEKLGQIKSQFWHKRAQSLISKPTPPAVDPPKQSLLTHLRKKHSECDPPQALKDLYMKFIPMRSVLGSTSRAVTNRKVAQSRLAQRVGMQFKWEA